MSYKFLCQLSAAVFTFLAVAFLFIPELFFWLIDVDGDATATMMARRAAPLFAIIGLLMFGAAKLTDKAQIDWVSLSIAIGMGILAMLGIYEFASGHAGPGMWLPVLAEAILAAAFLSVVIRGR